MLCARLLIERDPQPGRMNMAVDEVLLERAVERGVATLRWYRWSEATLSLGYFQKRAETEIPESLRALPKVRRLSGGGAIVHHHEWTYSCAIPAGHPFCRVPGELYGHMHRAIIDVLRRRGFNARLRGESGQGGGGAFLCFTRGDANDVLLGGHKIVGSAQRRRRGAILQHGSLLWRASEFAPQLPGLCDLAHEPADAAELIGQLAKEMGTMLGDEIEEARLSREELDRAAQLADGCERRATFPLRFLSRPFR